MPLNRRTFLQHASAFGILQHGFPSFLQQGHSVAAMGPSQLHTGAGTQTPPLKSMLHCLELPAFVDPLPVPPLLKPGAPKLRISMREIYTKVHRDVPPTRQWMYGDAGAVQLSGIPPVLEAHSHQPLQIEWMNELPTQHFLPIDHSLHGCGYDLPDVRTVTHLHGARVQSVDDGYPVDWFVPGKSHTSTYPLEQEATALWFHDHAMGLNRLNTYAGLFGMVLVRDEVEDALHLPSGAYELPLVLYDRNFTQDGQLFYPTSGNPERPWVPEFSGDAILVNGKIRPFVEIEPRLYRFRLLNVSNSRFFGLSLSNNELMQQIGSDQGLLAAPVPLSHLTMAPAERADLLVDFSRCAGQTVQLRNGGFEILQFRVAKAPASTAAVSIPAALRPLPRTSESSAVHTRTITLNEYQDEITRPMIMLLNRQRWHEPVTEQPRINTTEIWEFVNLTEDTHPMHLHLVRFQVLDRRKFEPYDYLMYKKVKFLAEAEPPAPQERGWKDVVQCPPGMITRIIARFEGYTGKYLYHCHVLEHEANDMMRPFEVLE